MECDLFQLFLDLVLIKTKLRFQQVLPHKLGKLLEILLVVKLQLLVSSVLFLHLFLNISDLEGGDREVTNGHKI